MKIEYIDVKQGTDDWLNARLAIPTASQFHRILTPARLQLSAGWEEYAAELCIEWFTGAPDADRQEMMESNYWIERGTELEPQARRAYEVITGIDTWQTGIIRRDFEWGRVGASPDGIIADDGLLELKCPSGTQHILYAARGGLPQKYLLQVQGQLWASGRAWADFVSYHPEFPIFQIRVIADPKIHEKLETAMAEFYEKYTQMRKNMLDAGYTRGDPGFRFAGMSNEDALEQIEREERGLTHE